MYLIEKAISIPGYKSRVLCGMNYGYPYVTQHNALVSQTVKEITFYNNMRKNVYDSPTTLVAVWHIKPKYRIDSFTL